jgi:hypothetical protein
MFRTIFMDWRTSVAGVLSWAIPFFASFPFFSPAGGLIVPQPLFKSIMVVVGTAVGVALLVWMFRRFQATLTSGIVIGLYWLVLNWGLDIVVLLPMSGTSLTDYFYDIGIRYLSLPIIAAGMGWAGRNAS